MTLLALLADPATATGLSPEVHRLLWEAGKALLTLAIPALFAWVRSIWHSFKRDRARTREAHDLIRMLAHELQKADPDNGVLRYIRAKASRNSDESWAEEGRDLRLVPRGTEEE